MGDRRLTDVYRIHYRAWEIESTNILSSAVLTKSGTVTLHCQRWANGHCCRSPPCRHMRDTELSVKSLASELCRLPFVKRGRIVPVCEIWHWRVVFSPGSYMCPLIYYFITLLKTVYHAVKRICMRHCRTL